MPLVPAAAPQVEKKPELLRDVEIREWYKSVQDGFNEKYDKLKEEKIII